MADERFSSRLGLSEYAIRAYIALVSHHPVNGSQLSINSGIPRARIYDVLRNLKERGLVSEVQKGIYVPLPPEEFIRRLRQKYEADLIALESRLKEVKKKTEYEFIWTIKGYQHALDKAKDLILSATGEIYIRAFPEESHHLDRYLKRAAKRAVQIKYISMKPCPLTFDLQVIHPEYENIENILGGRTFDMVIDRKECLGGQFTRGREDEDSVYWAKNRWFVIAMRDSLRHDYYHYFLDKIYIQNQKLSKRDKRIYEIIAKDY